MAIISLPELSESKGQNSVEVYMNKLSSLVFQVYGYAHFLHLSTGSYATHKALDELYSELPGKIDGLLESYLSVFSNNLVFTNVSLSGSGEDICDTILMYARVLHFEISKVELPEQNGLINDLEGLMSFISSVKYKLVRLS